MLTSTQLCFWQSMNFHHFQALCLFMEKSICACRPHRRLKADTKLEKQLSRRRLSRLPLPDGGRGPRARIMTPPGRIVFPHPDNIVVLGGWLGGCPIDTARSNTKQPAASWSAAIRTTTFGALTTPHSTSVLRVPALPLQPNPCQSLYVAHTL